ncbi:hypothetical protein J40TS1_13670 [Paenibacillus montaniterrae]|uniref:Uncharacterized protein n=1 Tax=Paenibacillus montaniterrae TaxID=429341 RepID=A0A920CWX5_9BACL|nr:DUF5325 family protein [Paenibacillus montaniterrae]GIP15725.1 hypothetical protein J40TS1_13670 [Paenibacillus montaniterrae]
MPKYLSLLFATIGILFLSAMSISIAHSLKWVIIWGVLFFVTVGLGFVVRRKYSAGKTQTEAQEE